MRVWSLFIFLIFLTVSPAFGQGVYVGPDGESSPQKIKLPFGFYNEKFGAALGAVYGIVGYPQKQSSLLAMATVGTEGSAMLFLMGKDIRISSSERLFFDMVFSFGYFGESETFVNGNPNFPNERAGSHDSDEDNYVEGKGWDNFIRMKFKYLLPMGHGKDQIISTYEVDRGMLKSGATGARSWNPLASGKTYLELVPFYRALKAESDDIGDFELRTNGVDFSIYWDNRDFPANPSQGHSLRAKVSRDFDRFNSSNSWTAYQFEIDKYFSLGATDLFRQRVIALDIWTSDSPTWKVRDNGEITNGAPAYAGSTLGGLWKMRGYPSQRFNDKAAIYYCAELRLIPRWNPFDKWPGLQKHVGVQWLQFVPFVEFGRVANTWNLSKLHTELNWSAGLGLRVWAKGLVVRIDTAVSDEASGIQMMISQPFQF